MDIDTQIIRYAKNHYGRSNNCIDDLKYVVSRQCTIPLELVTEDDVFNCINHTWVNAADKVDRDRFNVDLFKYASAFKKSVNKIDFIMRMISDLKFCKDVAEANGGWDNFLEPKWKGVDFSPVKKLPVA